MVQTIPLPDASIVVAGLDAVTSVVVRDLLSFGAQHITVISVESSPALIDASDTRVSLIKEDPRALFDEDKQLFRSCDLLLASNIPRPLELDLSHLRWLKDSTNDDPDHPMIVMRGTDNNFKMRCQYRELSLMSGSVSKFVKLEDDLPPWTDAKRTLVASTIEEQFSPSQNPDLLTYLAAAHAFVDEQAITGSWPSLDDKERVTARISNSSRSVQAVALVSQLCKGSLAAAGWTATLLARVIALDAQRLLTGDRQPFNNLELKEVFHIVAGPLGL